MANVPCVNPTVCGVQSHRQGSESALQCGKSRGRAGAPMKQPAPPAPTQSYDEDDEYDEDEIARAAGGIERAFETVDEQSDFGWGDMSGRDLARSLISAGLRTDDGRGQRELIADLDDLREQVDGQIESDEYANHLATRGWSTKDETSESASLRKQGPAPARTPVDPALGVKGVLDDYGSKFAIGWDAHSTDALVTHLVNAEVSHPRHWPYSYAVELKRDLIALRTDGRDGSAEEMAAGLTERGWTTQP